MDALAPGPGGSRGGAARSSLPQRGTAESADWRVASRTVLFALALLIAAWVLVNLKGVLIRVLLAVIVAAGMAPLVDHLAVPRPLGVGRAVWAPPRALVVLALYLLVFGGLGAVGALVVPPVLGELEDLLRRLPGYVAALPAQSAALSEMYPFLPTLDPTQGLGESLRVGAAQLTGLLRQALFVMRVALGVVAAALNVVLVLVLALYLTVDRGRVRRYLVALLPEDRQAQAERVAGRIGGRLGGWLRGQLALSALVGGVTLAGLWLIGVPYATLLALIAALGEAVPLVGPIVSAVPAVLLGFAHSPLQGGLVLGLYVLVQQLENHLLVPKVMERAVALHPLAVITALLAGSELLGVVGAVLAVPVAAAAAVVIEEVQRERRERRERKRALLALPGQAPWGGPSSSRRGRLRHRRS